MKLTSTGIECLKHGVEKTTNYTIAHTAKMFRLLSDSLYSDKIAAPIRELSTNAYDAHVAANKGNEPFLVHLPNINEPWFSIRDYGTGLSREQLETMYCQYGNSDKTHSNSFVGAMGLGSKSPFAYTKSFTTTSYYNGKKYIYINTVNEDGLPELNFIAESDTDEPNGLEVHFNVQHSHIFKFSDSARKIYKFFKVKPIIIGNTNISLVPTQYSIEDKFWGMHDRGSQSCVIMGNICYPIHSQYFDSTEQLILDLGIDLFMPIGSVEMDISREGLQYNKHTVTSIKSVLAKILDYIKKSFNDKLSNAKSYYEACCIYNELKRGEFRNFIHVIDSQKLEFDGRKLTNIIEFNSVNLNTHLPALTFTTFNRGKRTRNAKTVFINTKNKFYVNDVERGAYSRSREDSQNHYIYLLHVNDVDEFVKHVGILKSDLVYVSSLPKPPRRTYINNKENIFKFDISGYQPRVGRRSTNKRYWSTDHTTEINDGGYYCFINNFDVYHNSKYSIDSIYTLKRTIELFENITGTSVPPFYGIKSKISHKITNNPKWIHIEDYIKKEFEQFLKVNNISDFSTASSDLIKFNELLIKLSGLVPNNVKDFSTLYDMYMDRKKIVNSNSKYNIVNIQTLCRYLNITFSAAKVQSKSVEICTLQDIILKKYPMLQFFGANHTHSSHMLTAIVDYILLLTNQEK